MGSHEEDILSYVLDESSASNEDDGSLIHSDDDDEVSVTFHIGDIIVDNPQPQNGMLQFESEGTIATGESTRAGGDTPNNENEGTEYNILPRRGLEVIDDDDGAPPVPLSQFEAGLQDKSHNNGGVRGLETNDDDDNAPVPLCSLYLDEGSVHDDKNGRVSGLEMIDDGEEPFNTSRDGMRDIIDKKENKVVRRIETIDDEEAQPAPSSHNDENIHGNESTSTIPPGEEPPVNNIQQMTFLIMRYLLWLMTGIEPPPITDSGQSPNEADLVEATPVDDEETQVFHITYAPQEQGIVYEATPILEGEYIPFWKRYSRVACAARALVFCVMSVATVMMIGRDGEDGGPGELPQPIQSDLPSVSEVRLSFSEFPPLVLYCCSRSPNCYSIFPYYFSVTIRLSN